MNPIQLTCRVVRGVVHVELPGCLLWIALPTYLPPTTSRPSFRRTQLDRESINIWFPFHSTCSSSGCHCSLNKFIRSACVYVRVHLICKNCQPHDVIQTRNLHSPFYPPTYTFHPALPHLDHTWMEFIWPEEESLPRITNSGRWIPSAGYPL